MDVRVTIFLGGGGKVHPQHHGATPSRVTSCMCTLYVYYGHVLMHTRNAYRKLKPNIAACNSLHKYTGSTWDIHCTTIKILYR